uniref:Retroviral polymerase SH3-like domain-containing protein n=1 Tax=Cannabis sativa TaxID=3483 RepID=A0A803QCX9_CANSA
MSRLQSYCRCQKYDWLRRWYLATTRSIQSIVPFMDPLQPNGNGPRLFELQESLTDLRKGDESVNPYFTKLRAIWDEINELRPNLLCTCQASTDNAKFWNQEKVIRFINGLNKLYQAVWDQVLSPNPSHLYRRLPSYDHLCIFDCLAYASTLDNSRDKFSPRSRACVFIGYPVVNDPEVLQRFTNSCKEDLLYCSNIQGDEQDLSHEDVEDNDHHFGEIDSEVSPTEELEKIPLNMMDLTKMVKIDKNLTEALRISLMAYHRKNQDIFAWLHEDMIGIDSKVICHALNIEKENFRPMQQKCRLLDKEHSKSLKEEVESLRENKFMKEDFYQI